MKAVIICPGERAEVIHLTESAPLVTHHLCGKPFVFYWIEFLVSKGAKQIDVLATDRPEKVRDVLGDGSRWGTVINVIPERTELSVATARQRYKAGEEGWVEAPHDVTLIDHLPSNSDLRLFASYANFFNAATTLISQSTSPDRIGLREFSPGVWVGLHARISSTAKLNAPCWLGDHVEIGDNAEVGPFAMIESCSIVERDASISGSIVPPRTFVGAGVTMNQSIVSGETLINWKLNSSIKIADPFLLTTLERKTRRVGTNLFGRFAALAFMILTAPLAFLWVIVANMRAQPILRPLQAVNPHSPNPARRTIRYYEFANCTGIWQRWPQLWNIVRGEFAWVGNRPLNVIEAGQFTAEFEKLWLDAPVGFVSYADAEGCFEKLSDESKIHSCYYAVSASLRLDLAILCKVFVGCGKRNVTEPIPVGPGVAKRNEIPLGETIVR